MKVRMSGRLHGLPGALDVHAARAGETADDGLFELLGDRAHRLEIAIAGDREARLDHVHPQPLELASERELLLEVHAAARRLLAVAQRRIEDADQLPAHRPPSRS
jgi:hypothetical protein